MMSRSLFKIGGVMMAGVVIVLAIRDQMYKKEAEKEIDDYEQLKRDINHFKKQIMQFEYQKKLKKEGVLYVDLPDGIKNSIAILLEDVSNYPRASKNRLNWRKQVDSKICIEIRDWMEKSTILPKEPVETLLNKYDTTGIPRERWDKLHAEINKTQKYFIEEKVTGNHTCMIVRYRNKRRQAAFYIGIMTEEDIIHEQPEIKAAEQLHPDHYKAGKMDVISFCHHHKIDFCRGNIIKYVTRAGKKKSDNPLKELEDLKKAKVYLDREIQMLEETKNEI